MKDKEPNEEYSVKVGMYNKNFKMTSKEMLEERVEEVRGKNANFAISAGPLIFRGKTLQDTYVLDIDYEASYDAHLNTLIGGGFGARLFDDYGKKANELAKEFCDKNNLVINNHLNSWPKYQAVVSRKGEKK
jgi:hypothetical protein